ncbi:glycosyltransferase [Paraglaciecola aquimarina]|uniref:Glycosyltransferase n=1 Tax=Paraglaciecola algarum TaxID=3050085 RepID=A0ABS9DCF2_9ALTE|nr:glycosyltransferase [Paraglaciecola sp. G1-23]MCF2950419.1 glycosyltransferase [Paraglaciecola sp. G1-23]
MNPVKFSVVIPLYNKVESVERTILSICDQRLPASEIIVIDDGSTDGSAEKVASLKIANLTLVTQKNQGVSAARNNGVALAKNDYIAFIDADDQWSTFYLYEMNALIQRYPQHECFASNYQKVGQAGCYIDPKLAIGDISSKGTVLDNYFAICAEGDLPFMPSSLIISKILFNQLGGFPVGEVMGEDQALFSQIALHSQIVYSPLILMFYHTASENRACDRHLPQDILPFAQRLLVWVSKNIEDEVLNRSIIKYCAAHVCDLAKLNLQAGKLATAGQLLKHPICKFKPLHHKVFTFWLIGLSTFSRVTGLVKLNKTC